MPGLQYASPVGRWVLAATVLGSGIAALDATVVGIALPAIGRDFHVGEASLQWVVDAYTLSLAGLLLLGGTLGDRYGRRKVFLIGTVWFALASLLCGVAPNATYADPGPGHPGRRGRAADARAASPSCRPPSSRTTGRRPSAPGRDWAAWPRRWARSSAAG